MNAVKIDAYVCKLGPYGNFLWAKQLGTDDSTSYVMPSSLVVDELHNVYTSGIFDSIADFDPSSGIYAIEATGNSDIFIHKMSQDSMTIGISENDLEINLEVYPNPVVEELTIQFGEKFENLELSIRNNLGQVIFAKSYSDTDAIATKLKGASGVYFIELRNDLGASATFKIMKE